MEDTAVTRIGNQNFKILSCVKTASFIKNKGFLLEAGGIQNLTKPLIWEGCPAALIRDVESKAREFMKSLFDQEDGFQKIKFKDDDNKEYTILAHKVKPVIFSFLLLPLSDKQMREIEKNAKGKTYLTGDPADMFKTKKDFN